MRRVLAIALAACLVATAADARRRHHHRDQRSYVRAAVVVYVLTRDDCPRNPSQPTICYWRKLHRSDRR